MLYKYFYSLELIEDVKLNSREVQQELFPLVHRSYRDRSSVKNFSYENPQFVHNDNLLTAVS